MEIHRMAAREQLVQGANTFGELCAKVHGIEVPLSMRGTQRKARQDELPD
jgi:hypothetical protein